MLVKLMDGFTDGALGAARDTVRGVFIRRIIRRIDTVFCFVFEKMRTIYFLYFNMIHAILLP